MRKIYLIFLIMLTSLFINGCINNEQNIKNNTIQSAYTVTDDTGRILVFKEKPSRIISLTYGTDEILTELVDLKRILAYSRWAGDSEISFITKDQAFQVGKKVNENIESILALEPDLVVVSEATAKNIVDSLEALGVKVYIACSPHNYQEMCNKILNLAAAVGEPQRGYEIVKEMDHKLQNLEAKLSNLKQQDKKVALAFNFTAPMGRKGDLLDNMLNMAHVINGAALVLTENNFRHGQVAISKEMVVLINPDIFLMPTWNYNQKQDVARYADQIMHDPAYRNIKAVRNGQLKFVPDKYRYVASQHIVEAVEKIARTVYPECFK